MENKTTEIETISNEAIQKYIHKLHKQYELQIEELKKSLDESDIKLKKHQQ